LGSGIALGLLGDTREGGALFLRFYDAEGFGIDEEDVVGWPTFGTKFSDGDATGGGEVERGDVLHDPARSHELGVDMFS
jgi:hypothetical protein